MLVELITCTTLGFVLGCIVTDKVWYKANTENLKSVFDMNRKFEEALIADIKALQAKLGVDDA